MRALLLIFAALALSAPASAQSTIAPCTFETCALQIDQGPLRLGAQIVQGDSQIPLTGSRLLGGYYGPDVSPFVSSSPDALAYAQSYERSRTPFFIATVVGGSLLAVWALDRTDAGGGFLSTEARTGIGVAGLAGAVLSIRIGSVNRRRLNQSLSAYNESLPR